MARLKILLVHNYYGDGAVGGEDAVMDREAELLAENGHEVRRYERKNSEFLGQPVVRRLLRSVELVWSRTGGDALRAQVAAQRSDIVHVHNFWMVLSPSVFRAAHEAGAATVLTVHNYRLAGCPPGLMLRHGRPCGACAGRASWRNVVHRCYQGHLVGSIAISLMLENARRRRVWQRDVDLFVALTSFAKEKLVANGIPADRVTVKPNFVPDPLRGREPGAPGDYALYFGRLAPEKGVRTLVRAWRRIGLPLLMAGAGPLEQELRREAPENVRFLGHVSRERVTELLAGAAFFVFPSEWYEGFPCTLIEGMAMGRAVVATDLGARREAVVDGQTGLLFQAGSAEDLARKAQLLASDSQRAQEMGSCARRRYLDHFTPERNYPLLVAAYESALDSAARRGVRPS